MKRLSAVVMSGALLVLNFGQLQAQVQGSGTPGRIVKWISPDTIGDSGIIESGDGSISMGGFLTNATLSVGGTPSSRGIAASAGIGIQGSSDTSDGIGVLGQALNTGIQGESSTLGLKGLSPADQPHIVRSGTGILGAGNTSGVVGFGVESGVYGQVGDLDGTQSSPPPAGVAGICTAEQNCFGMYGRAQVASGFGHGVVGESNFGPDGAGVVGVNTGTGQGVRGGSNHVLGVGVAGYNSAGGLAAEFGGNVHVIGNLQVDGTVSKQGGSFKIDHPIDPANKYLSHSFVESPEMMNVYNGNVILDRQGQATVELPDYFQALNRDFRYQLTPVGGSAQLFIAEEVADNHFKIAGGRPGLKVSWQVTGTRQDAWANHHRTPTVEDKPDSERGLYLFPQGFGFTDGKGIGRRSLEAMDAFSWKALQR